MAKAKQATGKQVASKKPKTGGRKKGTPNKITREVKEAILNAFEKVGGEDYLVEVARAEPSVFCTLLGKILPLQITGKDGEDLLPAGFRVEVVSSGSRK